MLGLPTTVHWAHPWAFLLGTGPLWVAVVRRRLSQRTRLTRAYADAAMRPWAMRPGRETGSKVRCFAEIVLWFLVAAALAGPRQLLTVDAKGAAHLEHRVEVMVVLRTAAADHGVEAGGVSRLERARMALQDLQARLHGERLGLMIYARGCGLLLPGTSDPALFDEYLNQANARLLTGTQGPGLPGVLALARTDLGREPGHSRAIVLVAGPGAVDALDTAGRDALARQADALKKSGIPVYVLWTGPRSPAHLLSFMAALTGGRIARLGGPEVWSTLYDHGIARLPSNLPQAASALAWRELYGIPLAGAMLLLLILSGAGRTVLRQGGAAIGMTVLIAGAWTALHSASTWASDSGLQRWPAWQAWKGGHYARARMLYAQLPGYAGRMGEGACDYRIKAYAASLSAFRRAVLLAPGDRDRALALYNLGNAAFHLKGDLREALDAYKASLILLPHNPAAVRNLNLARAQWAEAHPEYEIVGMIERQPSIASGAFGSGPNLTPGRLGAKDKPARSIAYEDQALRPRGRLQTSVTAGPSRALGMAFSAADVRAARRGMQLLHDHRAELLKRLLDADSHAAAAAVSRVP
ncbi:MAG: hypothetical protein M0T84_14690 [Betaproteobacteria bacterium]|nr:hypothetical protein [Betaproteobacteria bacterium]